MSVAVSDLPDDVLARWDAATLPDLPGSSAGYHRALEASLDRDDGDRWTPDHLVLEDAICPLYERESWYGEFVWDGTVEEACKRSGLSYGPRGVAAIPWTPIRSPRILTAPGADRPAAIRRVASALLRRMHAREWTGVHLHFCAEDEAAAFVEAGWIERHCWQYVWQADPADPSFLPHVSSRRRRRIRREMRAFEEQGLRWDVVRGSDAPDELWSAMPRFYADTAARHGDEVPLTAAFFETARGSLAESVRFFTARRGDELVGATFQLAGRDALFGRIWGCGEAIPYLHFNLAYHFPIHWAMDRGLSRFEPGHGGEYKRERGCAPVLCRSVHRFAHAGLHRAVADWALAEAGWVGRRLRELGGAGAP